MLAIDLTGRQALVAGVGDERGFGFAIAKALADADVPAEVANHRRYKDVIEIDKGYSAMGLTAAG